MSSDSTASNTDSTTSILRSALSFFSGTLFSRITGAARDIAMASVFGSSPEIAAFMVAYRLSQLLRRLFGEATLPTAFIPEYERVKKDSPQEAAKFFSNIAASLTSFVGLVIIGIEFVLIGWVLFTSNSSFNEIVLLTALMLPSLLFISLFGLNLAFLQAEKSYFISGLAPVFFNLFWIGTTLLLFNTPPQDATPLLAIAIVVGMALQWLATVPKTTSLLKNTLKESPFKNLSFSPKTLLNLGKPLFLGLLGVTAVQINGALDSLFARVADPQGPAYLWYSIRIEQAPIGLFGIALSSALLPPLSRAFRAADMSLFKTLLSSAMQKAALLMLPTTLLLSLFAQEITSLIFERGAFSESDTLKTAQCLIAYLIGLVPTAWVLLLAPAFYAKKNYKHPAALSILSIALNIGLNALFVFGLHLGAISVAIATSIAAWVNSILLLYLLKKTESVALDSSFKNDFIKIVLASGFACGLTAIIKPFLTFEGGLFYGILSLGLNFAFFGLLFLGLCYFLKLLKK